MAATISLTVVLPLLPVTPTTESKLLSPCDKLLRQAPAICANAKRVSSTTM